MLYSGYFFLFPETKEAVGMRRASYQTCFQIVGIRGSWKETEGRAALLSGKVKISVASKVSMAFSKDVSYMASSAEWKGIC